MDHLKELSHIITKHKVKQIDIIGNDSNDDSKFQSLYSGIIDGKITNDDDAIHTLYGINNDKNSQTYNRLKNRLKRRLLNTLFFINTNQPQFTDIQKAYYSCNRNWLAVRILLSFGARRTGITLAERTLRFAQHYEFTELALFLSKDLRFHYSVIESNEKKYLEYSSLVDFHISNLVAETEAERHYTQLMRNYSSAQGRPKEDVISSARNASETLKSQFAQVDTFKFVRISYLVHVTYYQMSFQYEAAVQACYAAIKIFDRKPYHSQAARFTFELRLLSCLIQLKEFEIGQQIAESCMKNLNEGSVDWFVTQFYYFLLSSHSNNFDQSYLILSQVLNQSKFSTLYDNHKQLWHVNQAYVEFLIRIGKITSHQENDIASKSSFRLYKFLNDVPIYAKDKRGINISILIVHVLLLLSERKFTDIIDRVDALNQYCHRYLRRDDTFRSNCFIRMLLQMARADFNRIRTIRYAEKYKLKLESMPLNIAVQGIEVEIIPYEVLWDMVTELL